MTMPWGVQDIGWLYALPLTAVPWWRSPAKPLPYSWLTLLPGDRASRWIDLVLRALGSLAIAGLLLGLAGLYEREARVERIGTGAHTVLLLDRSLSMDDGFAGQAVAETESKAAAAQRVLLEFIENRPHDLIGIAEFSTSPLFVLPLTDNREAVVAAIRATRQPALAQTHVGKGLGLALSYFADADPNATRLVLLISDGAAAVDYKAEEQLRRWLTEAHVRLYWIFLRSAGSPGLFETPPPEDDNPTSRPERYLHLFFEQLGIPYQAFEAASTDGVARAVEAIDRLEHAPLRYTDISPKRDLAHLCFGVAALASAALAWAKSRDVSAYG